MYNKNLAQIKSSSHNPQAWTTITHNINKGALGPPWVVILIT